jgi:beta-lactamase superfamily II metal-dependent hydrolase
MRRLSGCVLFALLWCSSAFAQANGKLQIHYIDVGQGDAAVLISPQR